MENTRFQCGNDGLSSNNFTLRGGRSHFVSSRSVEETDNTNVQVAGITFEGANFFTAILGNAGDITFTDCVWKVSREKGGKRWANYCINFGEASTYLLLAFSITQNHWSRYRSLPLPRAPDHPLTQVPRRVPDPAPPRAHLPVLRRWRIALLLLPWVERISLRRW